MQLPDERLDLLLMCLRRGVKPEALMGLRASLLTDPAAFVGLIKAADRRMVSAALVSALAENGIMHPKAPATGRAQTQREQLGALIDRHKQRRTIQRHALLEIVSALNAVGIEPLLVKGAASLMLEDTPWRFQRDIDFHIQPQEVEATREVLFDLGYKVLKAMSARHHHIDVMVRPDPQIVVEPHVRINGPRAARIAGRLNMEMAARAVAVDGHAIRLLRPEHALLHGLVHHHFENRGGNFGIISLKGLLEFISGLESLDDQAIDALKKIALENPRLWSATELWMAASNHWLGASIPERLGSTVAADRRVEKLSRRLYQEQPASMRDACSEDFFHLGAVLLSQGLPAWRHYGSLFAPIYDCIHNRPWGGRPRALKSAGLLALT